MPRGAQLETIEISRSGAHGNVLLLRRTEHSAREYKRASRGNKEHKRAASPGRTRPSKKAARCAVLLIVVVSFLVGYFLAYRDVVSHQEKREEKFLEYIREAIPRNVNEALEKKSASQTTALEALVSKVDAVRQRNDLIHSKFLDLLRGKEASEKRDDALESKVDMLQEDQKMQQKLVQRIQEEVYKALRRLDTIAGGPAAPGEQAESALPPKPPPVYRPGKTGPNAQTPQEPFRPGERARIVHHHPRRR